jgi:hypothetical protein
MLALTFSILKVDHGEVAFDGNRALRRSAESCQSTGLLPVPLENRVRVVDLRVQAAR